MTDCAPQATWYSYVLPRKTANGEWFSAGGFTAAHHTLPFGTLVLVTYGDRAVVVRITDREPAHPCRVLDVTLGVARYLGFASLGVAPVGMQVVVEVPEFP